jgi:hypothetical protein
VSTEPNDVAFSFTIPDDNNWCAGLTAREYAAIQLRVPESGTPWLDAMIRVRLRDDFAAALAAGGGYTLTAYEGAAALLAGRERLDKETPDAM